MIGSVETMDGFELEAGTRLALDVAKGTAAAMGDIRCGTEHLLFGIVATSSPDMGNLTELFALDKSRVERAVAELRDRWCNPTDRPIPDPSLSTRAELALYVRPAVGDDVSPFDVLLGCLADPRSGASSVLRHLGVRPGEVRRLAELGAARLSSEEVERLVDSLDRRRTRHYGWWGPVGGAGADSLAAVNLPDGPSVVLAMSKTAVLSLDRVVTGDDGFAITLMLTSTDAWLLPPRWEPAEELIPGFGAQRDISPDVVTIDMTFSDGTVLSNRDPEPRFRRDVPQKGSLTLLRTHRVIDNDCDRRIPEQRSDSADWWVWPLPVDGTVSIAVSWPSESIQGVIDIDAASLRGSAGATRQSR